MSSPLLLAALCRYGDKLTNTRRARSDLYGSSSSHATRLWTSSNPPCSRSALGRRQAGGELRARAGAVASAWSCVFGETRPGRASDQTGLDRLADGLGLGVDVELVVDGADVVAHGVDADVDAVGRRLIAVSFGEERQ